MAGTVTHFEIGKKVFNKLKIELDYDIFITACQGHDLLYFIKLYQYPYFYVNKELAKLLQNKNFAKVVSCFEKYLLNNNNIFVKSFLYGYITHHLTDSIIHPFIIFETGRYNKNDKLTYKYKGKHEMLESIIDYTINPQFCYKYFPKINKNNELKFVLINIFDSIYQRNIGIKLYNNMFNIRRFWYLYRMDKYGIKKYMYHLIDKIFKTKYEFLAYNYDKKIDLDKLYEWKNTKSDIDYKSSINDLINESIDKSITEINNIEKNLKHNKIYVIDDVSAIEGIKIS